MTRYQDVREILQEDPEVFSASNAIEFLMFEVPALTIFEMMGVPPDELASMRKFARRLAVLEFGVPSDEEQVAIVETLGEFSNYCRRHVGRLIENPDDGWVSLLIEGAARILERGADRPPIRYDGDVLDNLCRAWGRHHCIGDGLARLGIRVALGELSRRLPHMELVEGQPWEYSPNESHRGPEHVLVKWGPAA